MIASHLRRAALLVALALSATGCATADRLANVGQPPALSPIDEQVAEAPYRRIQMPMPEPVAYSHEPNSLWRSGSRTFFKDQRAARVGDLLTVVVSINDTAAVENTSSRSRTGSETVGAGGGLDGKLVGLIPGVTDTTAAVNLTTGGNSSGTGSIARSEELTTSIAAVITQVMPNGNLVIEGRQEVRVNFEVRELIVAGVVRPEDIHADNTIESTKIAQARISYGGRGQITDVQQPRMGQQVMDILLPF